jgi:hypothetical protein
MFCTTAEKFDSIFVPIGSVGIHFDLYLHDIAEILLKMALNTNQSIHQSNEASFFL